MPAEDTPSHRASAATPVKAETTHTPAQAEAAAPEDGTAKKPAKKPE